MRLTLKKSTAFRAVMIGKPYPATFSTMCRSRRKSGRGMRNEKLKHSACFPPAALLGLAAKPPPMEFTSAISDHDWHGETNLED